MITFNDFKVETTYYPITNDVRPCVGGVVIVYCSHSLKGSAAIYHGDDCFQDLFSDENISNIIGWSHLPNKPQHIIKDSFNVPEALKKLTKRVKASEDKIEEILDALWAKDD